MHQRCRLGARTKLGDEMCTQSCSSSAPRCQRCFGCVAATTLRLLGVTFAVVAGALLRMRMRRRTTAASTLTAKAAASTRRWCSRSSSLQRVPTTGPRRTRPRCGMGRTHGYLVQARVWPQG